MSNQAPDTTVANPRKPWTPPQLLRLNAGNAEIGANPDNPEGILADGS
jgi:hypothetical protein